MIYALVEFIRSLTGCRDDLAVVRVRLSKTESAIGTTNAVAAVFVIHMDLQDELTVESSRIPTETQ